VLLAFYIICAHSGCGTPPIFAHRTSLCLLCKLPATSHSFCDFSLVTGRICMVNNDGGVLIDQYVQPQEKVTDYRTFVSGIEPKHLKDGAVSLSEAQKMVAQILTGRILVGHSVHHDLQVRFLPLFVICCRACTSMQRCIELCSARLPIRLCTKPAQHKSRVVY